MVLLIDNYDSFVFNLARYVAELGVETRVVRNDALTVEQIRDLRPVGIILSPGPCTPNESGVCIDVVRRLSDSTPMLGVCLGHQAIAAALDGTVGETSQPMHGMASEVFHDNSLLFAGMPSPFQAGRYHSLVVHRRNLPTELAVTAWTADDVVMGLQHRSRPLFGVQFHPESILTENGHRLLANFLQTAGLRPVLPASGDLAEPRPSEDFYTRPIDSDAAALL
jgi:anthranilate synthase/aminodeoxychorismate synthase-like glutamine amidotransferase